MGVLQSQSFCELLGGVITSWHASSLREPADLQPIENLTRLTSLTLMDGTNLGSMSELPCLQCLDCVTLWGYSGLATKVENFAYLQSLFLSEGQDEICNLSSCSNLTDLSLGCMGDVVKQVLLPEGNHVMLCYLSIGECQEPKFDFVMENLSAATKLREVQFLDAYPSNFASGGWPISLPHLTMVRLTGLHGDLPAQLASYPALREFVLTRYQQSSLPAWLSCMTQLTSLTISYGKLTHFPRDILQLSQLRQLIMPNSPTFSLTRDMLCLAHWPALPLVRINTATESDEDSADEDLEFCLESQLLLLELKGTLKSYKPHCNLFWY